MEADLGKVLMRRLTVTFMTFTGSVSVSEVAAADWASVTFSGQRHHMRVVLEGRGAVGAAADFLAVMENVDLSGPGCLVADIALIREEAGAGGAYAALDLELLTIRE